MNLSDYPATFQFADSAAVRYERVHFRLLILQILILLGIAVVSAINWKLFPEFRIVSVGVALGLIVLSLLQTYGRILEYDRKWFIARAIAESVKVQAWRFMMMSPPYDNSLDDKDAIQKFAHDLDQSWKQQPEVSKIAGDLMIQGSEVTTPMLQLRHEPVDKRRDAYLEERIREQQRWYSTKAKHYSKNNHRWLASTLVLQTSAGIIALAVVALPDPLFNPVGVVTTLASTGVSWMTAKSYGELSQSYGMIAHELLVLESRAPIALTQEMVNGLVSDVESTISREHTFWKARRLH